MLRMPKMFAVASATLLALTTGAFAYTATITDAQQNGSSGVCLKIEICWASGETAPTHSNTSATGVEVDNPPLDDNDPLGTDQAGAPVGTPQPHPSQPGWLCQEFWFCFTQNDCEGGNEEYSATVTVNGQSVPANGANGQPFEKNIC